jgi:FkbM family methyltransferase
MARTPTRRSPAAPASTKAAPAKPAPARRTKAAAAAPEELLPLTAKQRNRRGELDRYLPNTPISRVFDVGANVGQTCAWFNRVYPDAEIWAFEPVRATYEHMVSETSSIAQVRPFNVALGSKPGAAQMTNQPLSVNNRMVAKPRTSGSEEVAVTTGDTFCREHEVEHISYLKIDTEGFDLEVLRGFQGMLGAFAVDVVEVEASMNFKNTKHIPFERLKGFLEPMGYSLFRLYEQVSEFRSPELRRSNLVFLSEAAIAANPRPPRTKT